MMTGLREAASEDLPDLLKRLTNCLPYSNTVHGVIKIRLKYNLGHGRRVLMAPAPSSLVLITHMCCGFETQSLTLFWDVDQDDDRTVAELLGSTPYLDWTKPVFLYAVPIHLLQKAEQMVRSGLLANGRLVVQPVSLGHLYTITTSRLPVISRLPKEFRLGPIEEHHMDHLYKHWQYNEDETLESYKNMLRVLPNVGVYNAYVAEATTIGHETLKENTKKTVSVSQTLEDTPARTVKGKKIQRNTLEETITDDHALEKTLNNCGDEAGWSRINEMPVAWTGLSHNNIICNTYTLKEYRCRGLGRAVTAALAARVLQDDDRLSGYADYHNGAAIKILEQLGFTRECDVGWQTYSILEEPET